MIRWQLVRKSTLKKPKLRTNKTHFFAFLFRPKQKMKIKNKVLSNKVLSNKVLSNKVLSKQNFFKTKFL
ncbi:hypothetical protein MSWHS_1615 [Methanosarcina sp. WWM596]|nr:hypothetical protein MSWHS_1615 [Methanosarcina sp. WWM596]